MGYFACMLVCGVIFYICAQLNAIIAMGSEIDKLKRLLSDGIKDIQCDISCLENDISSQIHELSESKFSYSEY